MFARLRWPQNSGEADADILVTAGSHGKRAGALLLQKECLKDAATGGTLGSEQQAQVV